MNFFTEIKTIKRATFCFVLCASSILCLAQDGFKGVGIVGLNLSQLDGDTLHGFDRAGLSVGGKLYYQTSKNYNWTLEMLYSQRGSAPTLAKIDDPRSVRLRFVELPVTFMLNDWYIEKDGYYKVSVESGLSYSYLFQTKAPYYDENNFNTHELNYLVGATLRFTKKIGLGLRYTSSFGNIYVNPTVGENKLKSYFLTLRTEIYLN
jgi:hypothetical protein